MLYDIVQSIQVLVRDDDELRLQTEESILFLGVLWRGLLMSKQRRNIILKPCIRQLWVSVGKV